MLPSDRKLALHLADVGSLTVFWFDEDEVWIWEVGNTKGDMLQSDVNLQIPGESPIEAMKALIMFLLLEPPPVEFYDAVNTWVANHRHILETMLKELGRGGQA